MPFAAWLFIFAVLGTVLLTALWKPIAIRFHIVDISGRRRLHQATVVRGAGISIAIMMPVCCIVLYVFQASARDDSGFLVLALGLMVMAAGVGLIDDLTHPTSNQKLMLYTLLACLTIAAFYAYSSYGVHVLILLSGALVVHLNVWNFMDGSNGLITIQAIALSAAYLITGNANQLTFSYTIAMLGCCLAFLPFNYPNARMFLGDVGSHAIGAAVFGLFLLAMIDGSWRILEVLVLSSALWIDAILTFLRRGVLGYRVTTAHRSHLYQYLARGRLGHTYTALSYAAWTSVCIAAVYGASYFNADTQSIILAALLFIGVCLHQYVRLFLIRRRRVLAV
jgi:UDP-N-acetylmuramyl pentapeptide phosphotransferase/UDP-N-acetylglucosamine-1-phosphate transferase